MFQGAVNAIQALLNPGGGEGREVDQIAAATAKQALCGIITGPPVVEEDVRNRLAQLARGDTDDRLADFIQYGEADIYLLRCHAEANQGDCVGAFIERGFESRV